MGNWARLEDVCAGFDSEISTFELSAHTSLSFSPGSTSARQFRYMDLEREAVTNTELRGEYQLVASQIWCSAISKPHSNKSAISQPNTGGDYARLRSTVGHTLPVAPSSAVGSRILGEVSRMLCAADFAPNDVSKHQAFVEENYAQQEEVRFLPAHTQILQICATPFNEHRILDLTSGNGFTDIDPPPPINACLCRKEF
ncbi:uncharacterized protein ARMOST_15544 [Armillaria ostoyae]|uniref:Uncharacterized protein n=1 Tax=Armillaria ostoyae TaxID=47428 RepID=A0A284RTN9_ARMOS|nr:uncharacterized protein ARMOST_15544 [Armillaria ostoyae]